MASHDFDALRRERDELQAENDAALGWGAAVGARAKRIQAIKRILAQHDQDRARAPRGTFAWYAGDNAETFGIGPCATREEAIRQAIADGCGEVWDDASPLEQKFHLIEAVQDAIDLSFFVDSDDAIERLMQCVDDNHPQEDSVFDTERWSDEQHVELSKALETAMADVVRSWQERHALVIVPWQFTASRNAEVYTIPRASEAGRDALYWAA